MIIILQLALILHGLFVAAQNNPHYKRFCYVTTWAHYRDAPVTFNPEDIGASLCTHLSLAFAALDDTGTKLKATSQNDDPALYKRFTNVKKGHPHLKTLLSVGGWDMGSELFAKLVSSDANINSFAQNALTFLRDRDFDGLDIDWEFPTARGSPPADKHKFSKLLQVLHDTFQGEHLRAGQKRLLISIAVNPVEMNLYYEPVPLSRYADIINLMTYDMHGEWDKPLVTGHHSALYGTTTDPNMNIDSVVRQWSGIGVPKNKLLVGLPFYAKTLSLNDTSVKGVGAPASGPGRQGKYTREEGTLAYFEVCELLKNGAETHIITNQTVPYLVDHERWVDYDDEKSLQQKVKYVIDNGYGGIMVWALDLDDFSGICGKKYPLIHAVKDAFNNAIVGK